MISVTAYGAIFAANGCKLNFSSTTGELGVQEVPRNTKVIIRAALADIEKFENTANYIDGMAAIHLADYIDDELSPLTELIRSNLLTALGIMKDGKFVSQVLAQQKTNRSWHGSAEPNTCTNFGDVCTHRGITNTPGKRGRKSTRNPDQYHVRNASGEITKEQLVTPAIENLTANIPPERLISSSNSTQIIRNLEKMSPDKLDEILSKITTIRENLKDKAVIV